MINYWLGVMTGISISVMIWWIATMFAVRRFRQRHLGRSQSQIVEQAMSTQPATKEMYEAMIKRNKKEQ